MIISIRRTLTASALGALLVTAPAAAATYGVNTYSDPVGSGCSGGGCSLRQAINAVSAGAGTGDTITLQSGSYVLTQGSILSLGKPATITGAGANQTVIDAGLGSGVFTIGTGATGSILQDLAITRGQSTGSAGVSNDSSGLTLRRVWIHDNVATAFSAAGVNNNGTLSIVDSTISGNTTATVGGGIYNGASITISNSTVSGNTANATPSGWDGGGIYTDGPTQITNSTITGNTAATGGGISVGSSGSVTIVNTIVSGNTATGGGSPANCDVGGTQSSLGGNLDNNSTCSFSTPTDHQNTPSGLGPLQDNGGPTPTHALVTGSAAIGGGIATGCTATDQRGVARPQLGACDSGAYEFAPPVVTTGAASSVGANSADVAGTVGANLRATSYNIEYGRSTSYGSMTSTETLTALTAALPVFVALAGLSTSTTYHFRVVATNSEGNTYGADQYFKTSRFAGSSLVKKRVKIDSRGRVSLLVSCPLGTVGGKCDDVASLFATTGKLPVSASAAGKRTAKRLGRKKFSVAAGTRKTVKIRLSSTTITKLRSRSKRKLRLLITARDGDKHKRTRGYRVTAKR